MFKIQKCNCFQNNVKSFDLVIGSWLRQSIYLTVYSSAGKSSSSLIHCYFNDKLSFRSIPFHFQFSSLPRLDKIWTERVNRDVVGQTMISRVAMARSGRQLSIVIQKGIKTYLLVIDCIQSAARGNRPSKSLQKRIFISFLNKISAFCNRQLNFYQELMLKAYPSKKLVFLFRSKYWLVVYEGFSFGFEKLRLAFWYTICFFHHP